MTREAETELRLEVSRLRAIKDEVVQQAEQWRCAFLDAERERRRLEAMVKELEKAGRLIGLARDEQEARP